VLPNLAELFGSLIFFSPEELREALACGDTIAAIRAASAHNQRSHQRLRERLDKWEAGANPERGSDRVARSDRSSSSALSPAPSQDGEIDEDSLRQYRELKKQAEDHRMGIKKPKDGQHNRFGSI
jgi:hypothetical protein